MSLIDEIERLDNLKKRGALNELEYQQAKAAILKGQQQQQPEAGILAPNPQEQNVNMWGMLLHLSHFCGYVVPLAGLVVPIVLWQLKKNDSPIIDEHGKMVANWILTELILAFVFGLLCLLFIGMPLLFGLAAVGIIFPIIGAVKANNGEVWHYPMTFTFFK